MLVIKMGLDLHDVKIVNDGYQVKNVFIDDKEMKGVTKITYTEEVESVSSIIIEMFVNKLEVKEFEEELLKDKVKKLEEEVKRLKGEIDNYKYFKRIDDWKNGNSYIPTKIPTKVWYYKYDKPLDHGDDGFFHLHL